MPQIQYSLRFAPVIFVLVLSGRLLAQDPPALTLDGKPVDAAALDALAKTARAALENLKQTPPADADAAKARRERLERELGLVQRAKATLERLASSAKREADLQREIQAATAAAKAARAASEEPPKFVSMTEEELNAIVAAEKKALSEKSRSAATLTAADTHIAGRTSAFEGVAPAITKADAALAAARKALEGVSDPGVQAQRRHEIRLAGLGVGVLVLERDHHPQLLKLDTLERDLARLKDQIATAESRTAAVRLKAARTARSETLAEESAAAKRKADRKKADAEAARLKDLPVAQATFTLQGLVASVDAAGKTEAATLERLTRIVTTLDEAMVSIARRNDIVQKLFPAGADLDEWKLAALIEERRRLEAAQDRFDSTLSELASDVETRRRETLNTRNRLENLDALVDPGGGPRTREMSSFYLRGFDLDQDAFLDACAAFDGGEPKDRRLFNSRFESAIENLQKHIEGRTRRLSETEKFLDQFDALARSIQVALDDRLRHLDSISFWLRVPLPLGGAERAAAMTELSAIGGAAGGVVAHLDVAFPTWEDRAGGRTGLLALIVGWIGLALVGGRVLQRRRRATTQIPAVAEVPGTPHRILPWAAGRLATPVLLALGGWLLAQSAPEEPVADLLLAVAAALLGARLTTTIAGALFGCPGQVAAVSCEQRTAHAAHRFLRLTGIAASCLLPAAWLLERQGAPRLALLVRLLVGIWCVLLSAWLIFRRDVLAVLTPRRGGLVTRTIRVLMPYAWPGSVAFYAAVISLCLMGYRHAAWHYGSRLLFCGAALIATAVAYQLIATLIRSHIAPDLPSRSSQSNDSPTARSLLARVSLQILLLLSFAGTATAFSLILRVPLADWKDLLAFELVPRAGPDITLGVLLRSIAVLWIGLVLARWVRDLLQIALRDRMEQGSRYATRTLVHYTLVGLSVIAAISTLGIGVGQLGWFLTAAGVGIGFGLQEIISNFVAGLILFFERPVQVGDIVTVGEVEGDVTRITIRATEVRTRDGISIIIPNQRFITDNVINWSHGDQRTRLRIKVGVAYGSDVALVTKVLEDVASAHARVLARPRPEVNFLGFGESELSFELMAWLPRPDITMRRQTTTDLNRAVDASFRENAIQIPFPQRDLHLRSTVSPASEGVGELEEQKD